MNWLFRHKRSVRRSVPSLKSAGVQEDLHEDKITILQLRSEDLGNDIRDGDGDFQAELFDRRG